MNWVDITVVGIFIVSVLIGLVRGFTQELLSLTSWVLSFWLAFYFMDYLSLMYQPYIKIELMRGIVSFFSILIPTLVLFGITSKLLGNVMRRSPFGRVDRAAGGVFGFVRSGVLVLLSLFFLRLFFSTTVWWEESLTIPIFIKVMDSIKDYFPLLFNSGAFI